MVFKFKPGEEGGVVLKCQLFFRVAGMLMWWPLCAVVKGLGVLQREEVSAYSEMNRRDILKIAVIPGGRKAFQRNPNTDSVKMPSLMLFMFFW